ncbi:MAG: hypothetical protein QF682_13585 [Candidatus Thermoplasmatota archaeon]|nr:hypothetical protein [Candidatus Thermoplasmatota archaeon]
MAKAKPVFRNKSEQELFYQLEELKCKKLLETINYVLKILEDMDSDNYKFTARTYHTNFEQLLSERWIRSEKMLMMLEPEFVARITNPFARRILNIDIKVITKITSGLEHIKNILDIRIDSDEIPETMLTEREQVDIKNFANMINDQCWKFYRAVKLFESAKILLRAIEEHEEFSRDPERFKEKFKKIYNPIEVHE